MNWVEQTEQLGTGHAVKMALPHLPSEGRTLVLYGDVPLTDTATLEALLEAAGSEVGLLTDVLDNPAGYGRIIREGGKVVAIVEEKDANPEQKAVKETNTGILVLPNAKLESWLNSLSSNNAQGECIHAGRLKPAFCVCGFRRPAVVMGSGRAVIAPYRALRRSPARLRAVLCRVSASGCRAHLARRCLK